MDSEGNVNNTHSGGVSMDTSSSSRKRGFTSVTGGCARRNAVQASEMKYLEELKELAKSKTHQHGSSSSRGDDRMTE
ncbi:hypothetical protein CJ030_MR6G003899 [Morella rubra]|uniref:Uncharacterized protein n=1 Tax=Morella rubra TaxID=262757 RepID=A0A6A1VEC8_9ROSI|nr:hypothetical protein CJ030_MR6G003899 [Morella rubra]